MENSCVKKQAAKQLYKGVITSDSVFYHSDHCFIVTVEANMFSRPVRPQSAADITISTNSLAAIELDDHDRGQES